MRVPESRDRLSSYTTIGIQLEQEWMETEQRRHEQDAAVAILDISRVDDGMHQQTLHVSEDVTFLPFDLLARVVAMRVDRGPPFSALFTLWESMIQAVGLASRCACSRQATYNA